jgi:hypothetical protein
MEIEASRYLPLLGVLVTGKPDGALGNTIRGNPTHTDLYAMKRRTMTLHKREHKILTTFVNRVRTACNTEYLNEAILR